MKTIYPVLSLFVLVTLACSLGNLLQPQVGQSTQAAPVNPTGEPPAASATPTLPATPISALPAAGECQNLYYPVREGASWQYQLSGMSSDTFVRSISNVRENGFDHQDVFSAGVTSQGSWECRQGNLISLTPNAGGPTVSAEGMEAAFTIESNSGISLPANPQPGQEWTQNIVYIGRVNVSGTDVETRNVMDLSCKAIGMETVSVPAGEFEALRIDCLVRLEISISGSQSFTLTSSDSAWYAAGVGMVKSSSSSNMGASEIVLLTYSIP